MKILLATKNRDKVKEIQEALGGLDIQIVSASEIGNLPDIIEDQDTLEGNAKKKATILSQLTGLAALADDTGLEVEYLDGAPGVRSSRYAGENATYEDNVNKLLSALKDVPQERRKANFRTVIAFAQDGNILTVEGSVDGIVSTERRGTNGFGYDPVFYVPSMRKTFAELSIQEKNRISHRGIALKKIYQHLREK